MRFLANEELSGAEWQRLFDYFSINGNRDRLRQLILEAMQDSVGPPIGDDLSRFQQIADEVENELHIRIRGERDMRVKQSFIPWLIRFSVAASLLVAFSLSLYYQDDIVFNHSINFVVERHDVAPGRSRAMLTLADGRVVDLDDVSDGIIAKQPGLRIKKQEDGAITYEHADRGISVDEVAFNTISTPRGGQYKVTLPDGSTVWLNAASTLTYPIAFNATNRTVELEGEAYFDVKEDKARSFIVNSRGQSIAVLGTEFNVFAYADESATITTLVEGAVRLQYGNEKPLVGAARSECVLVPGQQAVLSGQQMAVTDVSTMEYTAWKDGIISFQDKDFETIIRQIERWYDVSFEPREISVTGKLSGMVFSDVRLSELLAALEMHTAIKFEIKGRRVIMQP